MKATPDHNVASYEGRHGVFFRVLASLTLGITVGLGVVCSLIWADREIQHARLVDRETLISLTGYIIFLVVTHAIGVVVTPLRSVLPVFTFAMSLVISFAVDMATASIATRRYQELWSDGPNNETVRGSWAKLSLPQRDVLQVELNCCGFAEPADDLFETVDCHPEAELPGCHLPWKDFLSYQAVGVATAFFTTAVMHCLLLVFVAGIIDGGIREGRKLYRGSAGSLEDNVGSSTAGREKDRPGDRDGPSRLLPGSRRPLVPMAAEGARTGGNIHNYASGPSPSGPMFSGAHVNRTSVTFDLPSASSSATDSPGPSQPVAGRSSIANPRDSRSSTLSADSVLSVPPSCLCTRSNGRGYRLNSGTNDHGPHFDDYRPHFAAAEREPSWEPAEAGGVVRHSRATPTAHPASKTEYPPHSQPSSNHSPSSSITQSYHSAREDIGSESKGVENRLPDIDVLKWGEDVERFITGATVRPGIKRSVT